jgi:hypothetical protein
MNIKANEACNTTKQLVLNMYCTLGRVFMQHTGGGMCNQNYKCFCQFARVTGLGVHLLCTQMYYCEVDHTIDRIRSIADAQPELKNDLLFLRFEVYTAATMKNPSTGIEKTSSYLTGNRVRLATEPGRLMHVRFEIFMAVTMKNSVFWDIKSHFVLHRKNFTSR